jgi:pimeloyl-ACP methyl ester carboxylesterase
MDIPAATVRKYGKPPFRVAVLHGGPGAPGYMAPVARELAQVTGVLEPLQTTDSLEGQISELRTQLADHADVPVTLIGSSWGAVLALILAAREVKLVRKLILVGSAVFDAQNSSRVEARRMSRLDAGKRGRYEALKMELEKATPAGSRRLMKEWGKIIFEADAHDPLTTDLEVLDLQYELHKKVWSDFVVLRDHPTRLGSEFSRIDVPVLVLHGDFDPHPIEGIRPFLENCLRDVRFHTLSECGHYPWIERRARTGFFDILLREISPLSDARFAKNN